MPPLVVTSLSSSAFSVQKLRKQVESGFVESDNRSVFTYTYVFDIHKGFAVSRCPCTKNIPAHGVCSC